MDYRQGDVGIKKIDKLPDGAKLIPTEDKVILAYGEATGHHHRFEDGGVALYELEGERFLEVSKTSKLRHEEHNAITFDPGIYKIIQQREYHPEAIRRVTD